MGVPKLNEQSFGRRMKQDLRGNTDGQARQAYVFLTYRDLPKALSMYRWVRRCSLTKYSCFCVLTCVAGAVFKIVIVFLPLLPYMCI